MPWCGLSLQRVSFLHLKVLGARNNVPWQLVVKLRGADSDYDPVLSLMHVLTLKARLTLPTSQFRFQIDMILIFKMMLKDCPRGWPTMDVEQQAQRLKRGFLPA